VSGSDEGTIRAWSLAGIEGTAEPVSPKADFRSPELQVAFRVTDGRFFADGDPAENSLGWIAGFRDGLEILALNVRGDQQVGREYWPRFLRHPVPGDDLLLTVRSPDGASFKIWTNGLHDPLWTIYPVRNDHWVLWTPTSHFYHSDDAAGRTIRDHFYWHVNAGDRYGRQEAMAHAESYDAQKFWSLMMLPHLQVARELANSPPQISVRPTYLQSQITIDRVWLSKQSADDGEETEIPRGTRLPTRAGLRVRVQADQTADEIMDTVAVWCNGFLIGTVAAGEGIQRVELNDIQIPRRFLSTRWPNQLHAIVESHLPGRRPDESIRLLDSDSWEISADESSSTSRLHYLGIGVTTLAHQHQFVERALQYADEDALGLGECLQTSLARPTSPITTGIFRYLIHGGDFEHPTRAAILKALDDMVRRFETAGEVSADDVFCIAIACHARRTSGRLHLIVEDTKPDLSNALLPSEIHERLRKLPCPTLLLIDACHSGGAESNKDLANSTVLGVGAEVLVSSQSQQKSWECDRLHMTDGQWQGHGLFTAAVIEAIDGRQLESSSSPPRMQPIPTDRLDRNSDGLLSVHELRQYIQKRVPELHDQLIRQGRLGQVTTPARQTPDVLPSLTFPEKEICFTLSASAAVPP